MKKILVFGASSSRNSINRRLALHAASQLPQFETVAIDLNDFEMPIFSIDRERESGIPSAAQDFKSHIEAAAGIIISFAEHNGSYSTAFKNIFDWASRLEGKMWMDRPMLLMATSPGGRGAQKVLAQATNHFPFMGGDVTASFSLPSFKQNFEEGDGVKDPELKAGLDESLVKFTEALS